MSFRSDASTTKLSSPGSSGLRLQPQKIDEAIRVLTEVLPVHLSSYAEDDLRVAHFRALHEAARDARHDREVWHLPFHPGPPKERLRDIKEDLRAIFRNALPKAGDEACYRFIKAVLPDITGEVLAVSAIKTEIIKRR
jgi:hypothetical protein